MSTPTLDAGATAATEGPAIAEFVRAVRGELADLPALTVDELVDGLGADIGALVDDTGLPIGRVVSTPTAYAAELRAAADLPARGVRVRAPRRPMRVVVVERVRRNKIAVLLQRDTRPRREFVAFARAVIPVWWVVRGISCAAVTNLIVNTDGIALAAMHVVAVVLSVEVGRRQRFRLSEGGRRRLDRGLDIGGAVLLVAMLPLFFDFVSWGLSGDEALQRQYDQNQNTARLSNGNPAIGNLFVYDSAGRLLRDARITDDQGVLLEMQGITDYVDPASGEYVSPVPFAGPTGQSFGVFPLRVVSYGGADDEVPREAVASLTSLAPLQTQFSRPEAPGPTTPS